MRLFFSIALTLLFVLMPMALRAAPFDTGYREWAQPGDKATFVARAWGDEFFSWMETSDGYRIVIGDDCWYYYATLDERGEFAPSSARVGIDSPPSESYHLERSPSRIAEIEQWLALANEQTEQARRWFAEQQAANPGSPVVLRIGVIFAEFQDIRHYVDTRPTPTRPFGYYKSDFDNMLFSENFWYEPSDTNHSPHPERELVFGSFRDYWYQMSRGQLIIEGTLLNPPDANGVPRWVMIGNRANYHYPVLMKPDVLHSYMDSLRANPPGTWPDTAGYHKVIIIYAQNDVATLLITHAGDRSYIQVPERSSAELYRGTNFSFSHIGTYAHEFGHDIGFGDEYASRERYNDDGRTCLFNFDLMAWGIYNGPDRKGACPATLSPYYRIDKGWISSTTLTRDTTNFTIAYNYNNPNIYRINPAGGVSNEHYLIETRLRHGFDTYIPTSPDSFMYQPGTLLVWHHGIHASCYDDRIRLTHADNTREWGSFLTDYFPSDPVSNRQSLNDLTTPAATVGSPDLQHTPPQCNSERAAHFSLNGIRKLSGGNTLIDTISLLTVERLVPVPVIMGWNLSSVPLTMSNYLKTALFPEAISAAFAYDPHLGYVQKDTLKNGVGYWIKFEESKSIVLGGGIRETDTAQVTVGWNIVGSITDSTDSANVCLYPLSTNRFLSPFYKFDNGYKQSHAILPGKGYWVKVQTDGQLAFHRDHVACAKMIEVEVSELDHFTVTDALGNSQDVYVANLDRDPSLAEIDLGMPPAFPEADFDARFEAGEYIRTVSPDSGVVELIIKVETQAYPVTVAWELNPENGIEYSIATGGMGKQGSGTTLSRTGSATMTMSSGGKFRFAALATNRGVGNLHPTSYLLAQNYPNPFNPETRIHYELPQDGFVKLVVYDVLGREVSTLVSEFKKSGRYDATYSARTLASGVYFYRLQAGAFNDAKKLLVIR